MLAIRYSSVAVIGAVVAVVWPHGSPQRDSPPSSVAHLPAVHARPGGRVSPGWFDNDLLNLRTSASMCSSGCFPGSAFVGFRSVDRPPLFLSRA